MNVNRGLVGGWPVLGAVLGVGLGLIFGISLQHAMTGDGLPVLTIRPQLGGFMCSPPWPGVLAAVFPARRAARMDVSRAVTTE